MYYWPCSYLRVTQMLHPQMHWVTTKHTHHEACVCMCDVPDLNVKNVRIWLSHSLWIWEVTAEIRRKRQSILSDTPEKTLCDIILLLVYLTCVLKPHLFAYDFISQDGRWHRCCRLLVYFFSLGRIKCRQLKKSIKLEKYLCCTGQNTCIFIFLSF